MKNHRLLVSFVALGSIAVGTVVSASEHEWRASPINADREVPVPVGDPTAEARAEFELDHGLLHYTLRMRKPIQHAFMAHIHFGAPGVAGPIVVWLFGTRPPNPATATDLAGGAIMATGELRASDFVGRLAGKSMTEIVAALDSGNYYVNIHTVRNRPGEIRGQVDLVNR